MAKRVNRRGWWGILLHATWATLAAVLLTSLGFGLTMGAAAGYSAALAGVVVWILSASSILLIAVVWKNHRNLAIPLAMAAFVAKIVILGLLLTAVPQPEWLQTTAAALGALIAIVCWQAAEVVTFMKTRRLIYVGA